MVGEEPEILSRSRHVMKRLRNRLAHVVAVGTGKLVGVFGHQVGQLVKDLATLGESELRPAPVVEGVTCCRDGTIGVGPATQCDLGPRLTRPRIDRLEAGTVQRLDLDAIDHVAEEGLIRHGFSSPRG
jgi:hypothetical protein